MKVHGFRRRNREVPSSAALHPIHVPKIVGSPLPFVWSGAVATHRDSNSFMYIVAKKEFGVRPAADLERTPDPSQSVFLLSNNTKE